MEELIGTLEQETAIYEKLVPLSTRKTQVIIKNELPSLQEITDQEQDMLQEITSLEHKRRKILENVGIVLNKDPKTLTIKELIRILDKQPEEQRKLCLVHDNLSKSVHELVRINSHNESLIQQSLEMIEFNMNFIQSTWMSPGSNNYTKGAANADVPSVQTRMFDAKQ